MLSVEFMAEVPEIEKKKLLEKQKKGKARMRQFGSVDIPQEAFIEVLKINKNE